MDEVEVVSEVEEVVQTVVDAPMVVAEEELEELESDETLAAVDDCSIVEELGLVARISALLFVATKQLTFEVIQKAANASAEEVEQALEEIKDLYKDDVNGFSLQMIANGYQFRSAPGAVLTIKRYKRPKHRKLSKAAAETLAVIAYKQPVQRAEIENIRGVDALPTLKTLLDLKLIRIVGHENSVGQPALYGTTEEFLELFGLNDLSDLPSIREISQLADEPGEVADSEDDPEIPAEEIQA